MGDFSGLQIGLSSLYAQRRALDVTGQNLANVNTEGYSRQRVNMTSDSGPITPAIFSKYDGTGMGVKSGDVQRVRDQFLQQRGYQEHAAQSDLQVGQQALSQVEQFLGEPSDTGLAAQMSDYWASWGDVGLHPDDSSARAALVGKGATLAGGFEQVRSNLASLSSATGSQLASTVAEVNAYATQIADLNTRIQSAEGNGLTPNDLLDQRDQLIGKVAERTGVTVQDGEQGSVNVFVDGTALVRGDRTQGLKVNVDASGGTTVAWTLDNRVAHVGGSTGGMLATVNDIIPRYQAQLDAVANQVMATTNTAQAGGFDLNGNPGQPFFVATPSGGIGVNPAVQADPRLVAAASTAGSFDGSVADALSATTGPDRTYETLVVGLGVEAQTANRRVDIQSAITNQIDAAQDSNSGVNIDEEMTNMISYQHAYDAAARYITAVDSMLDTLIHGTGLVGR
jgi:flagellar hook-associated protein 1 FlgK